MARAFDRVLAERVEGLYRAWPARSSLAERRSAVATAMDRDTARLAAGRVTVRGRRAATACPPGGGCCGCCRALVDVTADEFEAVRPRVPLKAWHRAKAAAEKLQSRDPREVCPLVDPATKTCTVYADRPLVCRAYSSVDPNAPQACEKTANDDDDAYFYPGEALAVAHSLKHLEWALELSPRATSKAHFDALRDAADRSEGPAYVDRVLRTTRSLGERLADAAQGELERRRTRGGA